MARKTPIKLPHAWKPRPWQARVLRSFQQGYKRFLLVVHRRAGKDSLALNMAAIASQQRPGLYFHCLPSEKSGRSSVFKGMDKMDGRKFVDQAFPHQLRTATREHALEIEFANGSLWKVVGSDNFDALRGGNPLGVTFSEFAFAIPDAWTSVIAPILRENSGWSAFISTPNGPNHFYELYQLAKANPDVWHVEYLTVDDTGLLTPEDIEAAKVEDGLTDADVRREFYCDWHATYSGCYYTAELQAMRKEGRIGDFEYDPKRPVYASWDLGYSDELVALFWQRHGGQHRCIGSRAWQFTQYADALADIKVTFPWPVEIHVIPHDAASQVMQGLIVEAFEKYGSEVLILPKGDVHAGIQEVRDLAPTIFIDNVPRPWTEGKDNNARLVEAIAGYRASNTRTGVYARTPVHSWESHWTDSLRYYAVANATDLTSTKWGPAPSTEAADRIARTVA